ncbi:ABC transporter permease [Kitasatospora phosalacinea]|uniref:ABC transporter permease n=1 Tax=Kitasatospora phosalacinea TaxID=2065 RepID=UPI00068BB75B|nr:ABC transporter permease [Kitasatospora phosalacinea]
MITASLTRGAALARHEVRILAQDPSPLVALVVMPLLVITFLRPAFRSILVQEGYAAANGSEQAVPGLTVMFSFFVVSFGGLMLFREHGWHTWARLQVAGVRTVEIVAGKTAPLLLLLAVQFALVFGLGSALFGFRLHGSPPAAAAVFLALACWLVALTMLMFAVCRTDQQMIALTNVLTMLFGGLGGALVPVDSLPSWARAVSPATPGYWAIRGFRSVTLDGAGLSAVATPVAVLTGSAVVLAALAAALLHRTPTKSAKGTRGY